MNVNISTILDVDVYINIYIKAVRCDVYIKAVRYDFLFTFLGNRVHRAKLWV